MARDCGQALVEYALIVSVVAVTRYRRLLSRRRESAGRGRTDLERHSRGRPNAIYDNYSDRDSSDDDHEEKEVPLASESPAPSDERAGES